MVFGFIIATVSSYLGFTRPAAPKASAARPRGVVLSSILIIVANVVLVRLIFFFFPEAAGTAATARRRRVRPCGSTA
jgi:phospholipid/cholesterol/gamma-HCH transport system permease protein